MINLKEKSTWTGAGSLGALALILGVPQTTVQVVGTAVIAVLNVYDLFRKESK